MLEKANNKNLNKIPSTFFLDKLEKKANNYKYKTKSSKTKKLVISKKTKYNFNNRKLNPLNVTKWLVNTTS